MAPADASFLPTAAELERARRVIAALAAGPLGAVSVYGKLVDRPVEIIARGILAARGQASQGASL